MGMMDLREIGGSTAFRGSISGRRSPPSSVRSRSGCRPASISSGSGCPCLAGGAWPPAEMPILGTRAGTQVSRCVENPDEIDPRGGRVRAGTGGSSLAMRTRWRIGFAMIRPETSVAWCSTARAWTSSTRRVVGDRRHPGVCGQEPRPAPARAGEIRSRPILRSEGALEQLGRRPHPRQRAPRHRRRSSDSNPSRSSASQMGDCECVSATSAKGLQGLSCSTGGGASRPRRLVGRDRELAEVAETVSSSSVTTVSGPARRRAGAAARHPHHAARRAARAPRPDRRQEGLRPRPVRRLHRAARRAPGNAAWCSPSPHDGADVTTVEGSPTAASCTRCSRPSSTTTRFQCGYCTPGQICSAVGMLAEADAGWPSHVTADLTARRRARRRRDPRADERQPLPLRRLRRTSSPAIAEAARDEALRLRARPTTPRPPSAAGRRPAGRDVPRRRHEPRRPHEARRRAAPTLLVDVSRLPLDRDRAAAGRRACASARPCATATWPPTRASASATRCSRRRCSPAPRASCATWRRRAGTCCSAPAASTSRTSPSRATSASPGAGCPALERRAPQPRDPRRVRALRRDPPVGHGGGAGRARRRGRSVLGPDGDRARSRSPSCTACPGDEPDARHGARATAS